jgi:carbon-monoxide dehydrogenase catalytic subunit
VEKNERGVCGITCDGMAMRMMVLRNIIGASNYHYHTEQTIKTLRATAEGTAPFWIKEPEKLQALSERLGITNSGSMNDLSLSLCDFAEADFNRKVDEPSLIVGN